MQGGFRVREKTERRLYIFRTLHGGVVINREQRKAGAALGEYFIVHSFIKFVVKIRHNYTYVTNYI